MWYHEGKVEQARVDLHTDYLTVPPIPSTAPFPWYVAKKFQIILEENSFLYSWRLGKMYRCLNWEPAPSINMLMTLIEGYFLESSLNKADMKVYTASFVLFKFSGTMTEHSYTP